MSYSGTVTLNLDRYHSLIEAEKELECIKNGLSGNKVIIKTIAFNRSYCDDDVHIDIKTVNLDEAIKEIKNDYENKIEDYKSSLKSIKKTHEDISQKLSKYRELYDEAKKSFFKRAKEMDDFGITVKNLRDKYNKQWFINKKTIIHDINYLLLRLENIRQILLN